ncbi:MAG: trypsin-like peptidase domain-containing protein [Acidobacteriota bacterium]
MLHCLKLPVCIALITALGAGTATADDLKDLARNAKTSVLLLRILDASNRELGSGTGFFFSDDGLLVTNHHVVAPAARIEAVSAEGVRHEVLGVLAQDEVNDLAVLRIATQGSTPLPLASLDAIDPGERVVVLGGPLGLAGSLSEGIVSAVRDAAELAPHHPEAEPLLQITAAISPGSSGSPVLNLEGEVVGVVASQYRVGQNLNFAVSVATLRQLLSGIHSDAPAVPLGAASAPERTAYLRNVAISAALFVGLFFILRRLK